MLMLAAVECTVAMLYTEGIPYCSFTHLLSSDFGSFLINCN